MASLWLSGKEYAWQCRRCKFDPWVRKIPWRRKRPPTPVFLPGKYYGQRNLASYIPVQFSHSIVSDSLWPHGLQHARLPCPLPTPGACSNFMSIESVIPSDHLILCHHLLLLPSIFPSIKVFSNKSALCIRWPKYYSFRWGKNGNSDSLYFLWLQSHCGWWL